MTTQPKILCLPGSARRDSVNKRLACAAAAIAELRGADVTFIDPADWPMPIYDGDLEAQNGLPENVRTLKDIFRQSDGMLIVSPEYNSSIPPLLKNVLDWVSRRGTSSEPPLAVFRGKVAALASASPGNNGGARVLVPLRMMLANIGVHVIPRQFSLPDAVNAFDEGNHLHDDRHVQAIEATIDGLVRTTRALAVA